MLQVRPEVYVPLALGDVGAYLWAWHSAASDSMGYAGTRRDAACII